MVARARHQGRTTSANLTPLVVVWLFVVVSVAGVGSWADRSDAAGTTASGTSLSATPYVKPDIYVQGSERGPYNDDITRIDRFGRRSIAGCTITDAAGLVFGSAGNLYVTHGSQVDKCTPAGQRIPLATGLAAPTGVAVDHAGNVYVTNDASSGAGVVKIDPSGATSSLPGNYSAPLDVAADPVGNVYVADAFNGLSEIMADGVAAAVSGPWAQPVGVECDGNGNMFVLDKGTTLYKRAPSGSVTTLATGLDKAYAIAVDSAGNAYLSERGTRRVLEIDTAGTQTTVASLSWNSDAIAVTTPPVTVVRDSPVTLTASVLGSGADHPTGSVRFTDGDISLDAKLSGSMPDTASLTFTGLGVGTHVFTARYLGDGNYAASTSAVQTVIVTDAPAASGTTLDVHPIAAPDRLVAAAGTREVLRIAPDGTRTTVGSGWQSPTDAVFDANGGVVVVDQGADRVVRIAPDGSETTIGSGLHYPTKVALDGFGNVYVADSGNNRAVKIAPDGAQATVVDGITFPEGIAVDAAGDLFVADTTGSRVIERFPNGAQATVGTDLAQPTGVAVDGAGNVYIADSGNDRVVVMSSEGVQSTRIAGLNNPLGVSATASGDLLIADTGANRVVALAAGAISPVVIASGISAPYDATIPRFTADHPYESMSLTATVMTSPPGTRRAAGEVTFLEGATSLGTAVLDDQGRASLAVTLPIGVHHLRAQYGGGLDIPGAESAPVAVRVTALAQTSGTTLTATPQGPPDLVVGELTTQDPDNDSGPRDASQDMVVRIAPNGATRQIGTGITYPIGTAVDRAGNVYITTGGKIVKVTPAGVQSTFATLPSGTSSGLAFDDGGSAYVPNVFQGGVVRIDPDGTMTHVSSSPGEPCGVGLDAAGDVFASGGSGAAEHNTAGTDLPVATGIDTSCPIGVDPRGNLIVGTPSGDLVRIAPNGTRTTVATGQVTTNVAIDGRGNLYTTTGHVPGAIVRTQPSGATTQLATGLHNPLEVSLAPPPATVVHGQPATLHAAVQVSPTGGAHVPPSGTVRFAEGSTTLATLALPSRSPSSVELPLPDLAVGTHLFTAVYSGGGPIPGSISAATPIRVLPVAKSLLIAQIRWSGPAGADDAFVELANNTDGPLDLSGYSLQSSAGTVSLGTSTLPVAGHLLLAGADFTPANGAHVDLPLGTITSPVRVVGPDGTNADVAGYTPRADGLQPPTDTTSEHAYVRREVAGKLVDTNHDDADFVLVSTDPATLVGATLGGVDPRGAQSGMRANDLLRSTLMDPTVPASAAPNREYDPLTKTLTVRRTITNTGSRVATSATARLTRITTIGSPGSHAVLRWVNSTSSTVEGRAVQGLDIDLPPGSTLGGGLGSTASVALPSGGLAPGQSVSVEFTFAVDRGGSYRFIYEVDATTSGG